MSQAAPVIRLQGIVKRFGEVLACDEVSFEIEAGRVHCLLGENGAGKSTLISLLAGMIRPDGGSIEIDGTPTQLHTPATSIDAGIAVVYQHSALLPTMTVLENLMLADGSRFWLQRAAAERRLRELREALGGTIDPNQPLGSLSFGEQQQVEIARAVWRQPRVLILDEPTSMLTDAESEALTQTLRSLAERGVAIVFVTHKLREALAIADTITVLRGGRVADRCEGHGHATSNATDSELGGNAALERRILAAMFGGDAARSQSASSSPSTAVPLDAPEVLVVDGLSTTPDEGAPINEVSLRVRAGEVLGIAGIDGQGQRHLAEAIAGQRPMTGGSVTLQGREVTRAGVRARHRLGLRYLTSDRLHEGIIARFSVALNLVLKRVGERPLWRFGFVRRSAVRREAARLAETFDVRTPSLDTRAGTLSGGNIQKLLLARELSTGAKLVIAHQPTHGLDLKTVQRVHEAMREFATDGGSALLISSELDELTALSHRIAVLSGGRVVGEVVNAGDDVRDRLSALIAGARTHA